MIQKLQLLLSSTSAAANGSVSAKIQQAVVTSHPNDSLEIYKLSCEAAVIRSIAKGVLKSQALRNMVCCSHSVGRRYEQCPSAPHHNTIGGVGVGAGRRPQQVAEALWERRGGVGRSMGGSAGREEGGAEGLRGAHPAGAVGRATPPLGLTPYLKPRTSRPLSARIAFYAVAWPLPGASLPQGRHLTLLLSGRVL